MTNRASTTRYLWTGSILTMLSILLMAAYGRAIQHVLEMYFGKKILLSITALFIIAGIWILVTYVFKNKHHRTRHFVLFCVVASLYSWRLLTLHVHAERFHLIEYGLLAILVTLAAMRSNQEWLAFAWGVCAVWFVGMTDEFFQWWLPSRVGEWRDVIINIQSGVLGLASLGILKFSEFRFKKPDRKYILALMVTLGFLVLLSGQFLLKVHIFGERNYDPDIGSFNSVFRTEMLLNADRETYRKTKALSANDNEEHSITDFHLAFYEREAREHFDRTLLLIEQNQLEEAHSENLILTRYYGPWMEENSTYYSDATLAQIRSVPPLPADNFYSRVMDWLLVGVSRIFVAWFSVIVAALIFALSGVYFFLKL